MVSVWVLVILAKLSLTLSFTVAFRLSLAFLVCFPSVKSTPTFSLLITLPSFVCNVFY